MSPVKLLFSVLVAASLVGCGIPVNGVSSDRQPFSTPAASPAQRPAASESPAPTDPRERNSAVKTVAMSLTSVADPDSKSYKVGPGDVLEVTVFKVPELSKVVQVSEAGTINFPLIGEVEASGKSAREIEQSLTKTLGAKYLQKPQISVFVKEHNSQRITIEGAIRHPGVYPIAGGLSLLQAVAQAQGFTDSADETVLLFRQVDGKRAAAKYDVSAIRKGNAEDPGLQAGDVIIAPTSDIKEGVNTLFKFLPLATLVPLL
jgi:polysaccharide biosynthesis/export protein